MQTLDYYEQALVILAAMGNRRGDATTCLNIGMVHRSRELMEAAALERAVELDEVIGHPDLESDRTVLDEVRKERDAGRRNFVYTGQDRTLVEGGVAF